MNEWEKTWIGKPDMWDLTEEPILEHTKGRPLYKWFCISEQKETGKRFYDIIMAPSLISARDRMGYIWGRGFTEEICIMRADANMMDGGIEWNLIQ